MLPLLLIAGAVYLATKTKSKTSVMKGVNRLSAKDKAEQYLETYAPLGINEKSRSDVDFDTLGNKDKVAFVDIKFSEKDFTLIGPQQLNRLEDAFNKSVKAINKNWSGEVNTIDDSNEVRFTIIYSKSFMR